MIVGHFPCPAELDPSGRSHEPFAHFFIVMSHRSPVAQLLTVVPSMHVAPSASLSEVVDAVQVPTWLAPVVLQLDPLTHFSLFEMSQAPPTATVGAHFPQGLLDELV